MTSRDAWPWGLLLIGALGLPSMRRVLEANMVTHMLVQIPLLAAAGVLLASSLGPRVRRRLEAIADAWPGMLAVWFASSYWMLPRALDAALVSPVTELAKFCSLPLLVGLPLALSWPRLGAVGRGFVLANAISMLGVIGWLYREAPVRLCNYYLIDQQVLLGNALLTFALLLGLACAVRAFTGPLHASATIHDTYTNGGVNPQHPAEKRLQSGPLSPCGRGTGRGV
jgi:hypothetical protein